MKKILLALLLVYFVTSTSTCYSCNSGTCTSGGDCASADQGSFNVNQQVVIDTPQTIAPPCPTPHIPVPVVNPPTYTIPTITPDIPEVCIISSPQVVAPPQVNPPTPQLPTINLPNIPTPQLPPLIPLPTYIPPRPTVPVILPPPQPVGPACTSLSNIFTLSFEWACRSNVVFHSCEANIIWNNVIIASIVPSNYQINIFKVNVTAVGGQNSLQIEGAGISDSLGLTIDNVQLIRVGSSQNIVINGGF